MPSSGVQTCALRSEEHTSELQSLTNLVFPLLLEYKQQKATPRPAASGRRTARRAAAPSRTRFPTRTTTWTPRTSLTSWTLSVFFNDTATTEIYTLSLHDALPIYYGHQLELYGPRDRDSDRADRHQR